MKAKTFPWHPADILCALTKKGLSYAEVARRHGLTPAAVKTAARQPSHAGEQAIAAELSVPAHQIWPDRYDEKGLPKHPRIRRRLNAAMAHKSRQNAAGSLT